MAKGIPLMGRGPDGKAKMINVDENGNVKVQQSGTKTEKLMCFDALALTDTNARFSVGVNLSKFSEIWIFGINTLRDADGNNVTVGLEFQSDGTYYLRYSDGAWVKNVLDFKAVVSADRIYPHALHTQLPILKDYKFANFVVRAQAKTVPASGSLTIYVWGEY